MARFFVDTAELRDLATRTRHHADEVRSITGEAQRELRQLVDRRAAPRLDLGAVLGQASAASRLGDGAAWAQTHESAELGRIAGLVEASQSGSAFGRGLSLGGLLFRGGASATPAALVIGGMGVLPFLWGSGGSGGVEVGRVITGLTRLPTLDPRQIGSTMPVPGDRNPLASICRTIRLGKAAGSFTDPGVPAFLRSLGSGAARLLGQVRTIALDTWSSIWRGAAVALREVRTGLMQVVAVMATAWKYAGPPAGRVGRWLVDTGRSATRWITNRLRADAGMLAVLAGTAVTHPSRLLALFETPPGYRDVPDPRMGKGTASDEDTWSEKLGIDGTFVAKLGSDVTFTGKRVRADDGTSWFEVDIEEGLEAGAGVGLGGEAKGGKSGKGARLSADLTGAQVHRVTYRFRTRAEAQRFIDGVRLSYIREMAKVLAAGMAGGVSFGGAGLAALVPRRSVFDIARQMEGWPDEDADTYELKADVKAKVKAGGTFAELGLEQTHALEVSEGNEKFSTELKGRASVGLSLMGLDASAAGEMAGKITIDPGDPTRLSMTVTTKVTDRLELGLKGKASEQALSQLKAQVKSSGGVGTEVRYRLDAKLTSAQAVKIRSALEHGDFAGAKRLLAALGATSTITVEVWGVRDSKNSIGFEGALGGKVGVTIEGGETQKRCLARSVLRL
jgi:hypothetical protein